MSGWPFFFKKGEIVKKKGFISLEWLIEILTSFLQVALVLAIVVGAIAVVWKATQTTPQEQDLKRIVDASAELIEDFEDGKVMGEEYITVPIVTEEFIQLAFYPSAVAPPPCKKRSCLCAYFIVKAQEKKKETCKIIETKQTCSADTCGKELCEGPYSEFTVKKGNGVRVAITCTDKGSLYTVAKV